MSTLTGVSIAFGAQPCTFSIAEVQAGISLTYEVAVSASVPGVVPEPQDDGGCDAPGPSGLILFEELDGQGQRYCQCDVGMCSPSSTASVTLAPGTWTETFTWDGRAWDGPGDSNNPQGPAFPAGNATLTVSAIGTIFTTPFRVAATFPVQITP
jgi:hypothetical protein